MSHLKHKKLGITIGTVAAIALTAVLFFYPTYKVTTIDLSSLSQEEREAVLIANEFLVNSPTYTFDGIQDSVKLIQPIETMKSFPPQYVIKFSFDSSHAGYGDRQDEVLAQMVTNHVLEVTVSDSQVKSAVLDKYWDELNQISITQN